MKYGLLDDVAHYGGLEVDPPLAARASNWPRLWIDRWDRQREFTLELLVPAAVLGVPITLCGHGSTNLAALADLDRALVLLQRPRSSS